MSEVKLKHFELAAADLGAHGDNDTLPFDIDIRFIKDCQKPLAEMAFEYFKKLDSMTPQKAAEEIASLEIFSERLLVPTGSAGFRITTKLHPFWNIYFNGLGVAIAKKNEKQRSPNAHSYRFAPKENGLFNRDKSWRAYKEATLADEKLGDGKVIVVQTDISSFYEHIYHHRVVDSIKTLFPTNPTIADQFDRILSKLAAGRSFGLPVGGQCSRILAELLMSSIDQLLTEADITWHRYVDDFTLICETQEDAYSSLANLSHTLADYGLSLNRSKTSILSGKHYQDYVRTQLGTSEGVDKNLREIDLHYDPYSDTSLSDYVALQETVKSLNVQSLLSLELHKSQPDTFLLTQISRTLKFQEPQVAIQLCETLLNAKNLHAFRASWATIMRGIATVRADENNKVIFKKLDELLDEIPNHSIHLLTPEASCLHYLKTIRYKKTTLRSKFISQLFDETTSDTIKRACIDCWRQWKDSANFRKLINKYAKLGPQSQRMVWLAASEFDDGNHFRGQVKGSIQNAWQLGIEKHVSQNFALIYRDWAKNGL